METHGARHDKSKQFECSICGNVYMVESTLKKHIAYAHDKSYAHLCNLCGASFQTTIQLVDHNYVVHEGKTYDCHLCEKTYETKSGV